MRSTEISKPSPVPKWRRLADAIAARIAAGEWGPGDKLSSEAYLTQEYAVSRITTRRAMQDLRERGLIITATGIGSFVREDIDNHD